MKDIIDENTCRYCPYIALDKIQEYVYRPCCVYAGPLCDYDMIYNLPACELLPTNNGD